MHKIIKNKKGLLSIYIAFVIVALSIILFAAIFVPMGVLFSSQAYVAGEGILRSANDSFENIQDPNVKSAVTGSVGAAIDSSQSNIQTYSDVFRYSWVLGLIVVGLVMFMISRRLVESGANVF